MIFMSESGLLDRTLEAEWDKWYADHLRIMETVEGISSAQRFKSDSPGYPPSLAMYTIASSLVFEDPYYQKIRGLGEWRPLIDHTLYRRNLFDGLLSAPRVPLDHALWLIDRDIPVAILKNIDLIWLKAVGLDQSTPYRGIAVVPPDIDDHVAFAAGVAIYKPFTTE